MTPPTVNPYPESSHLQRSTWESVQKHLRWRREHRQKASGLGMDLGAGALSVGASIPPALFVGGMSRALGAPMPLAQALVPAYALGTGLWRTHRAKETGRLGEGPRPLGPEDLADAVLRGGLEAATYGGLGWALGLKPTAKSMGKAWALGTSLAGARTLASHMAQRSGYHDWLEATSPGSVERLQKGSAALRPRLKATAEEQAQHDESVANKAALRHPQGPHSLVREGSKVFLVPAQGRRRLLVDSDDAENLWFLVREALRTDIANCRAQEPSQPTDASPDLKTSSVGKVLGTGLTAGLLAGGGALYFNPIDDEDLMSGNLEWGFESVPNWERAAKAMGVGFALSAGLAGRSAWKRHQQAQLPYIKWSGPRKGFWGDLASDVAKSTLLEPLANVPLNIASVATWPLTAGAMLATQGPGALADIWNPFTYKRWGRKVFLRDPDLPLKAALTAGALGYGGYKAAKYLTGPEAVSVRQAREEVFGEPVAWPQVKGELQEAVEARTWPDFKEEVGDSALFGQAWLYDQLGGKANWPLLGGRDSRAKFVNRFDRWREIFGAEGLTFDRKYLAGGSNYAKPEKVRAALELARLDQGGSSLPAEPVMPKTSKSSPGLMSPQHSPGSIRNQRPGNTPGSVAQRTGAPQGLRGMTSRPRAGTGKSGVRPQGSPLSNLGVSGVLRAVGAGVPPVAGPAPIPKVSPPKLPTLQPVGGPVTAPKVPHVGASMPGLGVGSQSKTRVGTAPKTSGIGREFRRLTGTSTLGDRFGDASAMLVDAGIGPYRNFQRWPGLRTGLEAGIHSLAFPLAAIAPVPGAIPAYIGARMAAKRVAPWAFFEPTLGQKAEHLLEVAANSSFVQGGLRTVDRAVKAAHDSGSRLVERVAQQFPKRSEVLPHGSAAWSTLNHVGQHVSRVCTAPETKTSGVFFQDPPTLRPARSLFAGMRSALLAPLKVSPVMTAAAGLGATAYGAHEAIGKPVSHMAKDFAWRRPAAHRDLYRTYAVGSNAVDPSFMHGRPWTWGDRPLGRM